nr:hypothetical protein CFP56_74402 [Quercus suber]
MIVHYKQGLALGSDVTMDFENMIEELSNLHQKWQTIFMWQDGPLIEQCIGARKKTRLFVLLTRCVLGLHQAFGPGTLFLLAFALHPTYNNPRLHNPRSSPLIDYTNWEMEAEDQMIKAELVVVLLLKGIGSWKFQALAV